MSTHAFTPDPLLDHFLHVSLQIPAIVLTAALVISGIIIVYILFFLKEGNSMKPEDPHLYE
jgi:hypothetical protein